MGTFVSGGGLDGPVGLLFGLDGNLYVGSFNNHQILRYNGVTGALIDVFVPPASGGLNQPRLFTTIVPLSASRGLKPDVELTASNGAFEFNGLDQSVNLGRSRILDLAAGDFTVHAWVNFASLTNGGSLCFGPGCDMSIVDKMASFFDANDDGWRLLKQSDDHYWFCLGGGSSGNGCQPAISTTVISETVVVPGVWYSVATVKTSSTISIYVNGVLEASNEHGAFTDTNRSDLRIGSIDGDAFVNGRVGQVELFRRALSSAQVRAIFEQSKAKYQR